MAMEELMQGVTQMETHLDRDRSRWGWLCDSLSKASWRPCQRGPLPCQGSVSSNPTAVTSQYILLSSSPVGLRVPLSSSPHTPKKRYFHKHHPRPEPRRRGDTESEPEGVSKGPISQGKAASCPF